MQITISVPTPVARTIVRAQFAASAVPFAISDAKRNRKLKKQQKQDAKKAAEYAKYIAEAQAHIGPYVPVSYTQVWS